MCSFVAFNAFAQVSIQLPQTATEYTINNLPDDSTIVDEAGRLKAVTAKVVDDTTALKLETGKVVGEERILKQLSSTNPYGGGRVVYVDSTYLEKYIAFDATVQGKQWARLRYIETGEVDIKWTGIKGDNSTDNGTLLQTVVSAFPDSTTFFFPSGVYIFDEMTLNNRSWLTFKGQRNSILKLSSSTSKGILKVTNSHHIDFENLSFDGDSVNVAGGAADIAILDFTQVDSSRIVQCNFKNTAASAIELNNSDHNNILYNTMDNIYGVGICVGNDSQSDTSSYNRVEGNNINRAGRPGTSQGIFTNIARWTSGADSVIAEYGYNSFVNNKIRNSRHVGIECWGPNSLVDGNYIYNTTGAAASAITVGSANNSRIVNNECRLFTNAGIEMASGSIGSSRNVIANNVLMNFNGRGIVVGSANTGWVTVTGNIIDSMRVGSGNAGIYAAPGKGFVVVSSNTLSNLEGLGILVSGPRVMVVNNALDYSNYLGGNGTTFVNAIELSTSGGQTPANCMVNQNLIVGNDSTSSNYRVYGIDYGTQSSGQANFNQIKSCYVGILSLADSGQFIGNYFEDCESGFLLDNVTRNPSMYALNVFIDCTRRWNTSSASAYPPQLAEEDFYFGNWGSGADVYENNDIFRIKRYTTLPDTTGWSNDPNKDGIAFILTTASADTFMVYDKALKLLHKIGMN